MSVCHITGDVSLDHLVKVASTGFLHCKVAVFPSVVNKYLGELL